MAGNVLQVVRVLYSRGKPVLTLLQDLRFALRQLRKHPGFTATAILSLALGIGATVSVFSVIYAVVLNPWPYSGADRICSIELRDPAGNDNWNGLTGPQIRQLRQARSLEDVLAVNEWSLTVTGGDVPEDVQGVYLTPSALKFLGIPAMLGRNFLPSDAPEGKEPQQVVVLSNKFWQRHFNGDPTVVGKPIKLVHKTYTILGVASPRFTFESGDVYVPFNPSSLPTITYGIYVKLRPGITREAAAAELEPLFQQFAKETPNHFPKKYQVVLRKLGFYVQQQLGATLTLLFGGVSLLLLIGCANVSILLLARGTARQHEFGIRSAVGASGGRIVRQLLTESLLLAFAGAGLGVALAYASLHAIVSRLPQDSVPSEADFHINMPVLLFSVGLALLTGIIFGLFPALQLARPRINEALQASTRKIAGTVRGKHFHNTLIAGQIALTLLLMTAAGAAIQGFIRMTHVPLGYDPHNVISIGIPIHENTYKTIAERVNFYKQMRAKIETLPQVISTGISTNATPPDSGWKQPFELSGKPAGQEQTARLEFVDPGYFRSLHVPLRQGRMWDETEMTNSAPRVLVNQTFAKRYYAEGNILGRSLKIPTLKNEPPYQLAAPGSDGWLQVVGVVADSRNDGLDKPAEPAIFLPFSLYMWMHTQILIECRVDPNSLLHSVQQQIVSVNADQQIYGKSDVLEMWIQHQPEWGRGRLVSILFAAFAGLALALSAIGLYSVVSYSVAQRTNEFGIRMALGARKKDVLWNVLRSAGVSVGSGLLAGLALSLGLDRLIRNWVENSAHDPWLILGSALVLLATASLACLVPSRRASSVDPMTALRCE